MSKNIAERTIIARKGYVLLPAYDTENNISDSIEIDVFAESSSQQFALGSKLVQGDRVYRYARNGAVALAAGTPLQGAAIQHTDGQDDLIPAAVVAIGAKTVTLTGTANTVFAANYYRDGYMVINDGIGQNHSYRIKSNTACTGAIVVTFTLYDAIRVALAGDNTTEIGLVKCLYDGVIAVPAPLTQVPVGVAHMVVTASYYFWVQTGGTVAAIPKAAVAKGVAAIVGVTAAKFDDNVDDTSNYQIIGYVQTAAIADGEACLIFLTLDR
jgi:hypothetical protein